MLMSAEYRRRGIAMNYRHGYHAGNFADVLKHLALCELLRLLTAKDKKLFVLDTHAGAGGYDLTAGLAMRTRRGRGRHRAADGGAACRHAGGGRALSRGGGGLRPQVRAAGGALRHYPGSPRLVRAALRPGDRFVACELHPQDALALKREFAGDRAVEVRQADGYHALKAMLPPVERRGLVLIDPPFEATDEFEKLARALRHGAAALRDRLLRGLVSDQGRGGGRGLRGGAGRPEDARPGIALEAGAGGQARGLRPGGDQSAVEVRGGDGARRCRGSRRRSAGASAGSSLLVFLSASSPTA